MKTAISVPDEMFREIEEVTKECDCSRSQVFVMAAREFLERRRSGKLLEALNKAYETPDTEEEIKVRRQAKAYHARKSPEGALLNCQGDLFWVDLGKPSGSGPGFRHPYVVLQNNVFNASRLNTVVLCVLTSNLERAKAPGNVLPNKGEGNLPKDSVINITQLVTVDKSDLVEKIGSLSPKKINQIVEGVKLLLEPKEV